MDIPKSTKEYFTWAAFKAIAPNFIKPGGENDNYTEQAKAAFIAADRMVSVWEYVTGVKLPQVQQTVKKSGTPAFNVRYGFPRD